jgi:hypothetical protein
MSIRNILGNAKADKLRDTCDNSKHQTGKINPAVRTKELEFTHHCKKFDKHHVNGNAIHYQYKGKLIGICFCDNANPKNNKYYIYA